jgi:uncharacterized membrane-anchored protein YitT (DUF2179 family)
MQIKRLEVLLDYVLLLSGAMIIAASFHFFLSPNQVVPGGVMGISILVEQWFHIPPAVTQWVANIPIYLVGFFLLGRRFAIKTAVGTVMLPLFVLFFSQFDYVPTSNPLLAAVYGGLGIGLGAGMVFRGQASTGGFDLIAQLLHRFTGLHYSMAVAILDGAVMLLSLLVFLPEKTMYALIGLVITSKTIDAVQVGLGYSKLALIVTDKKQEITNTILHDLDRGLTQIRAVGGYTGNEKSVLMVVVSQREVIKLKRLVQAIDTQAFVIISDTSEVLGAGFKRPGY